MGFQQALEDVGDGPLVRRELKPDAGTCTTSVSAYSVGQTAWWPSTFMCFLTNVPDTTVLKLLRASVHQAQTLGSSM